MDGKRHKPEEIVAKLRQVDVLGTQGQSVAEAIRSIGVTEVTYYRWRGCLIFVIGKRYRCITRSQRLGA